MSCTTAKLGRGYGSQSIHGMWLPGSYMKSGPRQQCWQIHFPSVRLGEAWDKATSIAGQGWPPKVRYQRVMAIPWLHWHPWVLCWCLQQASVSSSLKYTMDVRLSVLLWILSGSQGGIRTFSFIWSVSPYWLCPILAGTALPQYILEVALSPCFQHCNLKTL